MLYLLEFLLYSYIIFLDLSHLDSTFFKYLSVLLFVFPAFKTSSHYAFPYIFIILADYFFLFTNHYLIAIILFIFVQICFQYFLCHKILMVLLLPLIIIFLFINKSYHSLIALSFFYYFLSFSNLLISFIHSLKNHSLFFLTFSLLCLLICDTLIGINYIFIFSYEIRTLLYIMIWFFYLCFHFFYLYDMKNIE